MSRPYLTIHSISYTSSVITLIYTALKLRAGGSLTLLGFDAPQPFTASKPSIIAGAATFSIALSASNTFTMSLSYPVLSGTTRLSYKLNT